MADIRIPANKQQLIDETQKKVDRVEKNYQAGAITERERHNQLLDLWSHCREQVTKSLVETLQNDRRDPVTHREMPVDSDKGERHLNPRHGGAQCDSWQHLGGGMDGPRPRPYGLQRRVDCWRRLRKCWCTVHH